MQLQIFKYQTEEEEMLNEIKTIEIEGEIWFVAKDVAKTLGYSNIEEAVENHCKERGVFIHRESINENEITLINESNVYRLMLKSKLPSVEKFEEWLFDEVVPAIRKKGYYGKIDRVQLPNFIIRYKENFHKLPNDHFSVISEMYARLYIELEKVGYQIPDTSVNGKQLMPDISVGLLFAKYLRNNKSEYFDTHKKYTHTFPDGREVEANMYHINALPEFIRFINEKWIPENAQKYFKTRDPLALDYLPKLLSLNN